MYEKNTFFLEIQNGIWCVTVRYEYGVLQSAPLRVVAWNQKESDYVRRISLHVVCLRAQK